MIRIANAPANDTDRILQDRQMIKEGFNFWAHVNVQATKWDLQGYPHISYQIGYFTTELEGLEFLRGKDEDTVSSLHALEWGETWAEREDRENAKKAERKAKAEAKARATAEEMGISYKHYLIYQMNERMVKGDYTRIKNIRREIEEKEAQIAEIMKDIKERREKMISIREGAQSPSLLCPC